MKKIQFGSGGRNIEGWENHDVEVDIRKRFPYPDACASHILAEHVVEHVTHREAWCFFEECHRILVKGGIVRIAIPDITRMHKNMTDAYAKAVQKDVGGDGSNYAAIKAAVFEHGHMAAWNAQLLFTFLSAVGFEAHWHEMGLSRDPQLIGIEQHWKAVGIEIAAVETSVVEGVK